MSADEKCSECEELQPSQLFDPCCRIEALRRANREISRTTLTERVDHIEDELLIDGSDVTTEGEWIDYKRLDNDRVVDLLADTLREFGIKVTG